MKAHLNDFGEWLLEISLFWGTVAFVILTILLNALVICFTLVMWMRDSPSMVFGALACLVLFMISKMLTCRIFLGKRSQHGH